MSVSGDTLLIGAPFDDSAASGLEDPTHNGARDSGAAYVFTRSNDAWNEFAYVKAPDAYTFSWFGNAVAITGGAPAVAAVQAGSSANLLNRHDSASDLEDGSGAVYVFR